MSRFAFAAAFVILSLAPAFAEPNLPDIAARARAYRETLEAAPKSAKISQLLPNIRHAQESGAAGQALHLYEQLVGLEPDNYRSWLKLGLSWREVENGADGGVHAAWNAYKAKHAALLGSRRDRAEDGRGADEGFGHRHRGYRGDLSHTSGSGSFQHGLGGDDRAAGDFRFLSRKPARGFGAGWRGIGRICAAAEAV